ncbi:MAG: hypothetical protein AAGK21_06695 [Bacteroidota bacterium]
MDRTFLLVAIASLGLAACGDGSDEAPASASDTASQSASSDRAACDLLPEDAALATLGVPAEQVIRMPARPADEERFPEAVEFNRSNDERMRAEGTDCWYSVFATFRPSYDLTRVSLTTDRPPFDREGSEMALRGTWDDISGIGDEAYRMNRGDNQTPSALVDFRVGDDWYRVGVESETGVAADAVASAAESAARGVVDRLR